jgi:hypothetical protein
MVEFECTDCGDYIKRERHQMDIPGMTPQRCASCTLNKMGQVDDLNECWCCDNLTERGSLCKDCKDAGCNRFGDSCKVYE